MPLLGSIISGFLGRKIGIRGSHLFTISCLILSSIFSSIAFFEVILSDSPVYIYLTSWIDSEILSISWEFLFDSLSVAMLIPVLFISTLVHIFSINYMSSDPHNQRFFSYLSLFTFFMLILVTGANYLVMFVGWEGIAQCLKWNNNEILTISIIFLSIPRYRTKGTKDTKGVYYRVPRSEARKIINKRVVAVKYFYTISSKKLTSKERIGPHNIDIISIIIGSTLGDSHLEKRINNTGTRLIFEQSHKSVEYLMWTHKYLSSRGYCNIKKPKLHIRIKKKGEKFFHYRINSYTFSSLNWLHEMFYKKVNNKYIKIVPLNIDKYLSPLALAIWFMNDGSSLEKGARIVINCFSLEEISFICEVFKRKYNITATPNKSGKNKGYILYIHKNSMNLFLSIIKPYLLPSLYYKLGKT